MTRRLALAVVLALVLPAARADIGPLEVTGDFDAEFARAADLLEAGDREKGEAVLAEIRRRADQPAWNARSAFLLAADDARRGRPLDAAHRLEEASAASIGLEAYRRLEIAEALDAAGKDAALDAAQQAVAVEGPFALRARAGRLLARILEKRRRLRDALEALGRTAAAATASSDVVAVAVDRIRLGQALGDAAAARAGARTLLLDAPTADVSRELPAFARRAAAEAERGLTAAERGRRGAALVAAGDARRGVRVLTRDAPNGAGLAGRTSQWPAEDRARNLLALARGQLALKKDRAAEAAAALVPDDGTPAAYEARLFRCDLIATRIRAKSGVRPSLDDPRLAAVRETLEGLTADDVPASVRRSARERLLRDAADADRFDEALAQARAIARDAPSSVDGFEPLWLSSWRLYLTGDHGAARARWDTLAAMTTDISRTRRIAYWSARSLEAEGRTAEARKAFEEIAAAAPPDLYAQFAKARLTETVKPPAAEPVRDPSAATAAFSRVDELLRLRMFDEAAAEARMLAPSRGRDLRLAQADFALGRFLSAAGEIKRAIPEIGTAEEGRVPDPWRRLYYPIEEGNVLAAQARESGVDAAVLRGLVRQESGFDAHARSRAGALGLTQLMPATARSLAKSVLRSRYRRAFLYDPGVNARLGAAYLKRLIDDFHGSTVLGLAAYNGGPGRVARVIRENPGLAEDELFESIPIYETRDYVRKVMLYAESYRELYP